jgi:hypothetical protein
MRIGACEHAERDRGEDGLREFRPDQPVVEEEGDQREAELAARREHDAGAQRLEPLPGEGPRRERHDDRLDEEDAREQREHDRQVAEQVRHVELHADRHEEKAEERVAERADPRLDLVSVLGLRQHHACEEGAEGEGEAHRVRRGGRADRDEQHGEREELRRVVRGDLVEEGPEQPAAGGKHDEQRDRRLADRERDLERRVLLLGRRQHAGEREEGHDREVLEQQHAERRAGRACG